MQSLLLLPNYNGVYLLQKLMFKSFNELDFVIQISVIGYSIGLFLWLLLWKYIVGFKWLKKEKTLYLPFIGCLLLLIANIILTWLSKVHSYEIEAGVYDYVEKNAITVASFSMGIAVFVVLKFKPVVDILEHEESVMFLKCVFYSFLIVLLGVLPLYWIPQEIGWIQILRNLKTIPYLFALFILASGIIFYLHILSNALKISKN